MHFNSAGTWNVHTRKTDPMRKVPKKTKASHSEPDTSRQRHYSGVGSGPEDTRGKNAQDPLRNVKPILATPPIGPDPWESYRKDPAASPGQRPVGPTTGPTEPSPTTAQPGQRPVAQPDQKSVTFQGETYSYDSGTGTSQTDTGAHTGSTGPHQDHPHTYGPRAPTTHSIDVSTAKPGQSPAARPGVVQSAKQAFTGAARKVVSGDLISRKEAARMASIALTGLPKATSDMERLVALARASYVNQQNKYNVVF